MPYPEEKVAATQDMDDGKKSRSPCPGLNALAERGILYASSFLSLFVFTQGISSRPYDGRNITFWMIFTTMLHLNHSYLLSLILAISSVFLCGNILRLSVDLHQLARHNRIEHDVSMFHDDTPTGDLYAPIKSDASLLEECLKLSNNEYITLENLVQHKLNRERDDARKYERMSYFHRMVAISELAVVLVVLGGKDRKDLKIPKGDLKMLVLEDRFADNWTTNDWSFGVIDLVLLMYKLQSVRLSLKAAAEVGDRKDAKY